ncbi:MAG: immune inhibitor A [Bacteroidia bacterium]|nr:immune inhibitor A [Bacteroidia bacterium]
MKKITLLSALFLWLFGSYTQTVFFDNFESGTTNWTLTSPWGLTTAQSHSPTNSLTDSPTGNYANNINKSATMTSGVDLSSALSATLTFWGRYNIEAGFDYLYVEISTNNFTSFNNVATFDGQNLTWTQYTYDLGGYVGYSNVKIRFRLFTDVGYVLDGMYIDDVEIITSNEDMSPPLILHQGPEFYEGTLGAFPVTAEVIDVSGATDVIIHYYVDGGNELSINYDSVSGTNYYFYIPTQEEGAWVQYYIVATDDSPNANSDSTDVFEYVAGNHIIQDNGVVDFYSAFGPASASTVADGAAVKISLGNTTLVTALIRGYTDIDHPNDDVEFHIWADSSGLPGADIITPFMITPAASLTYTSAMTIVDLRPYSAQLSNLNGDYYIGFIVPSGVSNTTITQPSVFNRSYYFDGTAWSFLDGTDYHFRAVTTANADLVGPSIINNTIPLFYESFLNNDMVVNAEISDQSDIASIVFNYSVDGGAPVNVSGINLGNDIWEFTIPEQEPGAWVSYYIEATDNAPLGPFTTTTDNYEYIQGNYISYDSGNPNSYVPVNLTGTGYPFVAVKISLGTYTTDLVTILIRNYYNASLPNDDMEIHVWNDDAGLPGTDIMTPFTIASEAGPANTLAMTRVDLRLINGVDGLSGDFYIGFTVPSGQSNLLADSAGTNMRSFFSDGTAWTQATSDYMIRAITSDLLVGTKNISGDNYIDIFPNPMHQSTSIEVDTGEPVDNMNLEIYNTLGERVNPDISKRVYSFDVKRSSLPAGLYFYKIYNDKSIIGEGKLIIQ